MWAGREHYSGVNRGGADSKQVVVSHSVHKSHRSTGVACIGRAGRRPASRKAIMVADCISARQDVGTVVQRDVILKYDSTAVYDMKAKIGVSIRHVVHE